MEAQLERRAGAAGRPGLQSIQRWRRGAVLTLLAVLVGGVSGLALRDVADRREGARRQRAESLEPLAAAASAIFEVQDARLSDALQRLRAELRSQALWRTLDRSPETEDEERPSSLDASDEAAEPGREDGSRRLVSRLRRALESGPGWLALEVVVAGDHGLSGIRLEAGAEAPRLGPEEARRRAKALWYAEDVQRAVTASGRRVARGPASTDVGTDEDPSEPPALRLVVGLHEPGEVVQGALVALVDPSRLAASLEGLARADQTLWVVSRTGRPLSKPVLAAATAERLAEATARVLESTGGHAGVFASGERLVRGALLRHADGSPSDLVLLAEAAKPATGWVAWRATPWPWALPGVVLVCALAAGASGGVGRAMEAAAEQAPTRVEPPAAATPPLAATGEEAAAGGGRPLPDAALDEPSPVPIALREWLADVRGCLERDAARRGLGLGLRCERSLAGDLESDPAWLGGLVVALGREALDATSDARVRLEVREEPGRGVRFEFDAGGVSLAPVGEMEAVARRLGARFEGVDEARLALVVPRTAQGSSPA
jgi:hypothetical protein